MKLRNDDDLVALVSKYGYMAASALGLVGLLTLFSSPIGLIIIIAAVVIGIFAGIQKGDMEW